MAPGTAGELSYMDTQEALPYPRSFLRNTIARSWPGNVASTIISQSLDGFYRTVGCHGREKNTRIGSGAHVSPPNSRSRLMQPGRSATFARHIMKPNYRIADAKTPDGSRLSLNKRDGIFTIRLNGRGLMDSSVSASESLLGDLAIASAADRDSPHVLIGGLGLGFTLSRVLETTGPDARVEVAELIPAVVEWNREHLLDLNGHCLSDPRVEVIIDDIWTVLTHSKPSTFDSILLDIDNGPVAMVHRKNSRLYSSSGITQIIGALKPGGRLAVWSAGISESFEKRLTGWGLSVKTVPAKTHPSAKSNGCLIYIADKAG